MWCLALSKHGFALMTAVSVLGTSPRSRTASVISEWSRSSPQRCTGQKARWVFREIRWLCLATATSVPHALRYVNTSLRSRFLWNRPRDAPKLAPRWSRRGPELGASGRMPGPELGRSPEWPGPEQCPPDGALLGPMPTTDLRGSTGQKGKCVQGLPRPWGSKS